MLGSSRYTAVTKNLSLNEKEILIDNFSQKLSQKYNNLMHISNNVLKLLPDQTARRRLTRQVYFHTGTFTLNVRIPDKGLITARFNSLNTSTDLSFFLSLLWNLPGERTPEDGRTRYFSGLVVLILNPTRGGEKKVID